MEENYFKAKNIVSLKYDREDSYYPFFVLSIYALLQKYPTLSSVVQDIFLKTDIYIGEDSIREIIEKNDISALKMDEEEVVSPKEAILGLVSPRIFFHVNQEEISINRENPVIVCSLKQASLTSTLNTFVHEMNHLIKGYLNGYGEYSDDVVFGYYLRCGVNYYQCEYSKKNETYTEYDYHSVFEEVINTIQTTEMLTSLLALDGIIPDQDIQHFFFNLDKQELVTSNGYDACVKVMKPMWNNDIFRSLVEDNLYLGNVADIAQGVDDVLGENAFEDISDALDDLDELTFHGRNPLKAKRIIYYLHNKVKLYNKRTQKTYFK